MLMLMVFSKIPSTLNAVVGIWINGSTRVDVDGIYELPSTLVEVDAIQTSVINLC